jgi:hypothetical protein
MSVVRYCAAPAQSPQRAYQVGDVAILLNPNGLRDRREPTHSADGSTRTCPPLRVRSVSRLAANLLVRTQRMRQSGSAGWRQWISCGLTRDDNETVVPRTGTMRPAQVIQHETRRTGLRLVELGPIKKGTGSSRAAPCRQPCARPSLLRGPRQRSAIRHSLADGGGGAPRQEPERPGSRAGRSRPRDGDEARRLRDFSNVMEIRSDTWSGAPKATGNLSTINALTWIARLTYFPSCARIINRTYAGTKVQAVRQIPSASTEGRNRTMSPTRRRRPAADAGAPLVRRLG